MLVNQTIAIVMSGLLLVDNATAVDVVRHHHNALGKQGRGETNQNKVI